tara:strand:+ start:617 stop:1390 length:774 start_codon:yes stop_codon:yes gene_type:complete
MTTKRIIGKIDIKGGNVIKGMRFEGLRLIDELRNFLSIREDDYIVDEIYLNNITGSLYDTHIDLNLLQEICQNIHIPVTVQGGITSLKEIEMLLEKGASRVALNTSIIKNKVSIETLFREFGYQAIVFSPSIRVDKNGDINFFVNAGREIVKLSENINPYNYLSSLSEKGLIEVLLRLIEFDGVNKEINEVTLAQIRKISTINIDVIISGSMHIQSNYTSVLNFGVQGIALSYMYIHNHNKIEKIRSNISKSWEVRI